MHRLPKIFTHNSDRRKTGVNSNSKSSSSQQSNKPKPRFERCNASKNINYELPPSTSSSSYSLEESLRTRSLDLFSGKKSFRVDGNYDEIQIICKSLGFSGIDDLAICPEDYQAMKMGSASAPVAFSQIFEVNNVVEISGDGGADDAMKQKIENSNFFAGFSVSGRDVTTERIEETQDYGDMDRSSVPVFDSGVCEFSKDNVRPSDDVRGGLHKFRGNGIKGVRPPVLAPPSLMLRAFAMKTDTSLSRFENGFSLEQDGEEGGQKINEEEGRRRRIMTMEENCVLSESYSFTTTSNDDDTSSTTTEPISSVSPNGRIRRTIMEWQKGELLGSGSFGSVYEGIADDGFFFAVKEVSLLDQRDEGRQSIIHLEQEIALLSQFEHENIVRYYGTKKDESHLYIFLELVTKGSLLSLYQKYVLRDSQVSAYTRQILHGLSYLHDRNVVHRDIKCANILVDTNGLVKLADFGLAKLTQLNDVKSCKGTAFWMAPEVVKSLGYGLSADIWSLGCTVLEMLTGRFPYSHLEWMSALFWIGRGERPPIPDSLSGDARDFILTCLQVDPSSRPTAAQLLDHPFVKRPLPSYSGSASPHYFGRQL